MAVRLINRTWRVDIRVDGIRHRIKSPENSKAGAASYEAHIRGKLARGEPIGKAIRLVQELQFTQFAERWFKDYVETNNKYHERRNKKYILASSLIPFFGKIPLGQITTYHVEQFKASQRKKGASAKTINNRLTVLRKCLVTASDWGQITGTLPRIALLKAPPPKMDYLSPDECDLLLAHSQSIIREIVFTALRTGMRQGELKGLQWSSIDWQNRSITVRHSQNDYTKKLEAPKSNRERHIPMDTDLYGMLFRRKKNTGYVFLNRYEENEPFNAKYLERRLAEACKRAGLRKIGWHTLRHTFASHLIMQNNSVTVVQNLLGHSSITTTMKYVHLAPSALRSAIDTLSPKTRILGTKWAPNEITNSV